MKPEIAVAAPIRNRLGEAPMWNGLEQALYWIDALAPAIHRLGASGELSTWPMPCPIGSFAFRRSDGLIGALEGGFCAIDLMSAGVDKILDPEPDRPENVLNDGKCDRHGRYWCGSRDGALAKPTGRLFRLDPDLRCRTMDEGFIVSNGIAWSPDDRTMYFADSRPQTVWAYDFDAENGEIRNRRVFFSTRDIAMDARMLMALQRDATAWRPKPKFGASCWHFAGSSCGRRPRSISSPMRSTSVPAPRPARCCAPAIPWPTAAWRTCWTKSARRHPYP